MAFEACLADLQSEACCPLCLDYLRDPVTLDCGHNFCESCIQERWEDLEDIFPCPVCLHHCPDKNFTRNNQLCLIAGIVKQLPSRTEQKRQEERLLCEKHNEVLDLFCEEDLELLCPQCRTSPGHEGHHLIPTEKAAVSQRKKLKTYTKILKKQIKDAEVSCDRQVLKSFEVRKKIDTWKKELQPEFEEIKIFLRKMLFSAQVSLILEGKDLEDKLNKNKHQISKHISTLKHLLYEITMKCLQTDVNLLQNIGNIYDRYEALSHPDESSYEFKKRRSTLPPNYFGLQRMISTFQAYLTLDPETAHSFLAISEDRKSVSLKRPYVDNSTEFMAYPAVLSCEGFNGGRHFWQVLVRGTGEWSIGLCKESVLKNRLMSPFLKTSFWSFQQYTKITETQDTELENQVLRFGFFLDFELGEFSVFRLNKKSYLYRLTDKFTEKMVPYFAIRPSSTPLSISLATEE